MGGVTTIDVIILSYNRKFVSQVTNSFARDF